MIIAGGLTFDSSVDTVEFLNFLKDETNWIEGPKLLLKLTNHAMTVRPRQSGVIITGGEREHSTYSPFILELICLENGCQWSYFPNK